MRPEFQIIPEKTEKSFIAKRLYRKHRPHLNEVWHYHPEIEICYTQRGHGKHFVGNTVGTYGKDDLLMFGSNLPHGFTTTNKCIQVVILFDKNYMGNYFFESPELSRVKALLAKSNNGLIFKGDTKEKAKKIISGILKKNGLPKMIGFLKLLDLLAETEEFELICNEEYSMDLKAVPLNRIKIVYNYIMEHYQKEVKIKEIASLVNLSEASFFKFVKRHTDKTFTQMINEFRINHASKLLMSTDRTISEICYNSGYNNISYFNRKFKEIMLVTPNRFRDRYKGS